MLLFVLAVGAAGISLMWRRPIALVVTVLLTIGVPVSAVLISQISPGYASRTIQMALIGWCIAVGWLASRIWGLRRPIGQAAAATLLAALIAIPTITLPATLGSAGRYEWSEMSRTLVDYRHLDKPIIAASTAGMLTDLIYLYGGGDIASEQIITVTDGIRESWYIADRWLERGPTKQQVKDGALIPMLPFNDPSVDAVWFVSRIGRTPVYRALENLGYQKVLEQPFSGGVLWLWARPGANLGDVLSNNGDFVQGAVQPDGWAVGGGPYRVEQDPTGGRRIVLTSGPAYQALSQQLSNASEGIYTLTVDATGKKPVTMAASLHCFDASGFEVARNRTTTKFASHETPLTLMIGVNCPQSTTGVLIKIERSGDGDLAIDKATLTFSRPYQS
jgi:hypothetical protein